MRSVLEFEGIFVWANTKNQMGRFLQNLHVHLLFQMIKQNPRMVVIMEDKMCKICWAITGNDINNNNGDRYHMKKKFSAQQII